MEKKGSPMRNDNEQSEWVKAICPFQSNRLYFLIQLHSCTLSALTLLCLNWIIWFPYDIKIVRIYFLIPFFSITTSLEHSHSLRSYDIVNHQCISNIYTNHFKILKISTSLIFTAYEMKHLSTSIKLFEIVFICSTFEFLNFNFWYLKFSKNCSRCSIWNVLCLM